MLFKFKKKLLSILSGALVVSIIPITVVSCSNSSNDDLSLLNIKTQKMEQVLLPNNIQEQFILSSQYYSGQINYFKGTNSGDNQLKNEIPNAIGINGNNETNNSVVQMGKGDSLVLVFNQNDNLSKKEMNQYINSLYFYDSSVGSTYTDNGNNSANVKNSQGLFVKFNNTSLSTWYYGSQTNHLNPKQLDETFGQWLSSIASSYTNHHQNQWEQILNYYGYVLKNNKYVINTKDTHVEGSTAFRPLGIIPQTLWVIKQIANNAFTFTFNASSEVVPSITAASIWKSNSNSSWKRITSALSLGNKYEWNAYTSDNKANPGEYNIIGQKLSAPLAEKGKIIDNSFFSYIKLDNEVHNHENHSTSSYYSKLEDQNN